MERSEEARRSRGTTRTAPWPILRPHHSQRPFSNDILTSDRHHTTT